jgi:hypothetical protein
VKSKFDQLISDIVKENNPEKAKNALEASGLDKSRN